MTILPVNSTAPLAYVETVADETVPTTSWYRIGDTYGFVRRPVIGESGRIVENFTLAPLYVETHPPQPMNRKERRRARARGGKT